MIISPDSQVATYAATQVNTTQTLTIALSSETVQELDLTEGQVVKGSVSEDGNSITLNTNNGSVNVVGNFTQVSGETVNVRVNSKETQANTENKQETKIKGREPTRQSNKKRGRNMSINTLAPMLLGMLNPNQKKHGKDTAWAHSLYTLLKC